MNLNIFYGNTLCRGKLISYIVTGNKIILVYAYFCTSKLKRPLELRTRLTMDIVNI